jgi:hypothetical protein
MSSLLPRNLTNVVAQFSICFWMKSEDKDNYGTPFSYAVQQEDNEVL